MAIPSGSGTEVLSSTYIHAQSNTETSFRWDGTPATTGTSSYTVPTNYIITVLNINFTDMGDAEENLRLWVDDGSNLIFILFDQTVPAHGTFIYNDRLVLKAGHKLVLDLGTTGNVDAYLNYIVQDWS
tara:strand:- start:43 stop:426 length:384 start_codon:yes stop_codon:yes gene_type:complete